MFSRKSPRLKHFSQKCEASTQKNQSNGLSSDPASMWRIMRKTRNSAVPPTP